MSAKNISTRWSHKILYGGHAKSRAKRGISALSALHQMLIRCENEFYIIFSHQPLQIQHRQRLHRFYRLCLA